MKTADDTIMMSKDIRDSVDVTSLSDDVPKKKKGTRVKSEVIEAPTVGPLKCDVLFSDSEKLRCDVIEYRNTDVDISVCVILYTHDMVVSMLSNEIVGISMLAGDFEIVDIHCDVDNPNDRPALTYMAAGHSNNVAGFRDCSCVTLTFKRDS